MNFYSCHGTMIQVDMLEAEMARQYALQCAEAKRGKLAFLPKKGNFFSGPKIFGYDLIH